MRHLLETTVGEPLVHFLAIGAALFLLFDWKGNAAPMARGGAGTPATQITVSRDLLEQQKEQFTRTWQRPPTADEEKGILEDLVRNEVYYREAMAAGLDRDDEVLKRRLRQKMEFIYEDVSSWAEPSDAELAAFLKAHREKYLVDPSLSFRQVLISVDRRGKQAETDALRALERLRGGANPDSVGDPTMLPAELRRQPLREIALQFGDQFAQGLLAVKGGSWEGPIRSSYGLHLVQLDGRQDGQLPELAAVREAVKRDWLIEKQKALKDAAYAKLRERYTVVVEKPRNSAAAAGTAAAR